MKIAFLTAVAATAISIPAFAQNFSGPRIEAHVGWEQVGAKGLLDDGLDLYEIDGDKSGVTYGGAIGYDFQVSEAMIAGIEANFDLSDTKKCGPLYGVDEICLKAKRDLDVSFRMGQQLSPTTLFYVKVGYANGRFNASYEDFEDILPSLSQTKSVSGIRVGAGVEAALGSNAYIKGEYRYTDYKTWKYRNADLGVDLRASYDRHQILGGIGYRF